MRQSCAEQCTQDAVRRGSRIIRHPESLLGRGEREAQDTFGYSCNMNWNAERWSNRTMQGIDCMALQCIHLNDRSTLTGLV